jgi:hypothetical protein
VATLALAPSFITVPLSDSDTDRDFTRFSAYLDELGVIYSEQQDGVDKATATLPAQPDRQDVGNTPFETRPDFGNFFSQGDFSGGSPQTYFHRPSRDETKYFSSEGFDITEPGILRHLNVTAAAPDVAGAAALAQALGLPLVADGNNVYEGDGTFPGNWTSEDPHDGEGAVAVLDLTSSGDEVYAALGVNGIHLRDDTSTWSHYVAYDGTNPISVVAWLKGRLMASDGPNIYEITASGALPAALETLPTGWTFTEIFEGGGFVFGVANNADAGMSRIHTYGLNSDATALELKTSTPLPKDEIAYVGIGYLGRIFIGGGRPNDDGGKDPILYEAIATDAGDLQLLLIAEGEDSGATDLSVRAMEATSKAILVGWCVKGERAGLAKFDLARNAFSFHLKALTDEDSEAVVRAVMTYKGRLLFDVSGDDMYYEDLGTPVTTATLVTSIADWATVGHKVWDLVEVRHAPLQTNQSIVVEFTRRHPDEAQWEEALTSGTPGAQGAQGYLEGTVKERAIALRLTSTATATESPNFFYYSVRSTPAPTLAQYQLVRRIRVFSEDRKNPNAEQVIRNPREIHLQLHDLINTWLTLYEPGITFRALVQSVADLEPVGADFEQTTADSEKEGYVVELRMVGTRES